MANLLLVEDDRTLLSGMAAVLMIDGHRVRALDDSTAALSEIEADPPELIISDVSMPGMTGPQLLDTVRARVHFSRIPFLFVSAGTSPDLERQLSTLDRVHFLGKPFEVEWLSAAVAAALNPQSTQIGASQTR